MIFTYTALAALAILARTSILDIRVSTLAVRTTVVNARVAIIAIFELRPLDPARVVPVELPASTVLVMLRRTDALLVLPNLTASAFVAKVAAAAA